MTIAIGSDHAGYELKEALRVHMEQKGITVTDLGGFAPEKMDYPVAGARVAEAVASGAAERGVVVCGTGVGISIAANKVPGIRCVVCSEPYSARQARLHNDANMLSLGARVVGGELALMILDEWLAAAHEGGRHARRVAMITEIEKKYAKT